jgi:hypothetical protein
MRTKLVDVHRWPVILLVAFSLQWLGCERSPTIAPVSSKVSPNLVHKCTYYPEGVRVFEIWPEEASTTFPPDLPETGTVLMGRVKLIERFDPRMAPFVGKQAFKSLSEGMSFAECRRRVTCFADSFVMREFKLADDAEYDYCFVQGESAFLLQFRNGKLTFKFAVGFFFE